MKKNKLVASVIVMQLFLVFGLGAADKAKAQTQSIIKSEQGVQVKKSQQSPAGAATTVDKIIKTDVSKTYDKKTDLTKGTALSAPIKYFSPTIQLENEAMKLMIELDGLKKELGRKIQDFAIEQVFGSKKEPAKKNPLLMDKILFWKTPLPTSDPAIASLSSAIAGKEASLKKLEADIDSKYRKFVDILKTYRSLPGSETDKDYIKTLLLYMTTEFRRGVGADLHTELAGLVGDPDCASDLVSNQPFLKYGVYSLDEKFAYAITTLLLIRQQVGCISSSQLAIADFYSFEAADRTMAVISDDSLKQQFIDLTINPLLIIYDAGKSQFSRGMDYMNEYLKFAKNSYNKNGILYKLGFYLADETNFTLTEVKFGDKAVSSYAPDPKTYDPSGITTPFGIDTGFLKAKWCMQEMSKSKQPASWSTFTEDAGNPEFIGNGASSMKDTIAFGIPDLIGIDSCGGDGGGGEGGGSSGNIVCKGFGGGGDGGGGMQVLKVCHVKVPPIKNPPPASINTDGSDGGSPSTSVIDTKTVSKAFSYKNSFSCPSPSSPTDEEKTPTTNTQDANKNKGIEEANKKKDALAKAANSKATEEEKAAAAKKAADAVKKATIVNGLKIQGWGDQEIMFEDSNDNNQFDVGERTFGISNCATSCGDGVTHTGGVTFRNSDGSSKIIFDSDRLTGGQGSLFGIGGTDGSVVVTHEWAHAYYNALGIKGSHHDYFDKANVKYCSASGDECSAGCNAGEMLMMTYYDCPDQDWSPNQNQEACGNSPVMPSGSGGVGVCPDSGGGLFGAKTSAGGGGGGDGGPALVGPMSGMAFPGQVGSTPCEGWLTDAPDICVFAECMIEKMPNCGGSPLCTAGGGGGGILINLFKSSTGLGVTDPSPIMEKLPVWMQEQYKQTKFKTQGTPVQQGGAAQKLPQKK